MHRCTDNAAKHEYANVNSNTVPRPRQHAGFPQEGAAHHQGLPEGAGTRWLPRRPGRGGGGLSVPTHSHEQSGGGLSPGQRPAQDQCPGVGGEVQQDGGPGGTHTEPLRSSGKSCFFFIFKGKTPADLIGVITGRRTVGVVSSGSTGAQCETGSSLF